MEIPETKQAAALAEVARIGADRAEHLRQAKELMEPLEAAAVAAVRTGAERTRVRKYAQVSPKVFYGWLEAAGLEVQPRAARQGGDDDG